MDRIEDIEKAHLKSLQGKKKLPEFDAGDTINSKTLNKTFFKNCF